MTMNEKIDIVFESEYIYKKTLTFDVADVFFWEGEVNALSKNEGIQNLFFILLIFFFLVFFYILLKCVNVNCVSYFVCLVKKNGDG